MTKIDINTLELADFCSGSNMDALLTAGNIQNWNTMTIGWLQYGILWGMNTATVFVRPNRYTYEFMEKGGIFTISTFDKEKYPKVLGICGSVSGRDTNKSKTANITPIELEGSVGFEEAKTTFVLEKLYKSEMKAENFVDTELVKKFYQENNPLHQIYVGEIISAYKG